MIAQAQAMLATGGEVWVGDETAVREFPPLRASWSKCGTQATVLISGRNARRVVHGALHTRTGELVRVVRERHRADDSLVFVSALGAVRPEVPKLLIWDNAPRITRTGSATRRRRSASPWPSSPSARPNSTHVRTSGAG